MKCMDQLSEEQKRCIMMAYYYGYSHDELSKSLEKNLGHVNQADWGRVNESASLAISAEPMGGSPTGRPTRPITYRGKFVSLI